MIRKSKIVKPLKIFFNDRQEILLAFLFGSFASNRIHPSSDVDIGILYKTVPPIDAVNDLKEELSSILQREVDLVVLNQASPVLKMQILKSGILLYASERRRFNQFFIDTVNQYDDLKRIRKNCEESILKGRIYAAG
jgi:predicted nucleotidyltransferase